MKRLELSERDMDWLQRGFWYFWHTVCVGGEAATESVKLGLPQHYSIDDYIQIWQLNKKLLGSPRLTPTEVKRVKRLYGKMWRGEEDWQAFARDQAKKFQEWEDKEIMKSSK